MKPLVHCAVLAMLVALAGCTREWRTEAPVTPSTWSAQSYRSTSSVGRLSRLAVLPVLLEMDSPDADMSAQELDAVKQKVRTSLRADVVDFLVTRKGYEARAVDAELPDRAPTTIQAFGATNVVDGVVVIERWLARPWSTAKAIGNIFMLNIPLYMALSAENLRITIYETASGARVWEGTLKGEDGMNTAIRGKDTGGRLDLSPILGDLENAVPAQLRR